MSVNAWQQLQLLHANAPTAARDEEERSTSARAHQVAELAPPALADDAQLEQVLAREVVGDLFFFVVCRELAK